MKTREPQWFDLFQARATRRDFLRVGGSVAGLVALGGVTGCGLGRLRLASDPFTLGVASGDPSPDGAVLWTRLARAPLMEAGVVDEAIEVRWEVAEDEGFRRIARRGSGSALPELGHSVHVELTGLEPARDYFYRFMAGGEVSPTGRTKTAPTAGSSVDRFRFAFVSCQHYETGHYTAYQHLSAEELDLVVHLGDYIYEGGPNARVRVHEGPEIMTLDDYRARYTTYRGDPHLQTAHAAAPWVLTWDDHEVDNDYAAGVPEDDQSPEAFLLRRAAAYQAYYEFMPLRRAAMPSGPHTGLYRRLEFGSLIEMNVLDTRQYRSDQPCGSSRSCPEHMSPHRTMLGADQRRWLFDGLAGARGRWTVLAQQVAISRMRRGGPTPELETWAMDKWDGAPVERQALLSLLAESGTPNPIVLTGDHHFNALADLKLDFDDPASRTVGTEFIGTSISSGGDGADVTRSGRSLLERNPHFRFHNGQRGYVSATVTPDLWTSEYKVVPVVSEPGGPLEVRATFVVEDGRPGAQDG